MKKIILYLSIILFFFSGCSKNSEKTVKNPKETVKTFIMELNLLNSNIIDESIHNKKLKSLFINMPDFCYSTKIENISDNSEYFIESLMKEESSYFKKNILGAKNILERENAINKIQDIYSWGDVYYVQQEMKAFLAIYFNDEIKFNKDKFINLLHKNIKKDTNITNICLAMATKLDSVKAISFKSNTVKCIKTEECIVEGTLTYKYEKFLDRPYVNRDMSILAERENYGTIYDNKQNTEFKFILKNINDKWMITDIDNNVLDALFSY